MAFFRPRNKPPSAKAVQQWLDTGEAAPHVQVVPSQQAAYDEWSTEDLLAAPHVPQSQFTNSQRPGSAYGSSSQHQDAYGARQDSQREQHFELWPPQGSEQAQPWLSGAPGYAARAEQRPPSQESWPGAHVGAASGPQEEQQRHTTYPRYSGQTAEPQGRVQQHRSQQAYGQDTLSHHSNHSQDIWGGSQPTHHHTSYPPGQYQQGAQQGSGYPQQGQQWESAQRAQQRGPSHVQTAHHGTYGNVAQGACDNMGLDSDMVCDDGWPWQRHTHAQPTNAHDGSMYGRASGARGQQQWQQGDAMGRQLGYQGGGGSDINTWSAAPQLPPLHGETDMATMYGSRPILQPLDDNCGFQALHGGSRIDSCCQTLQGRNTNNHLQPTAAPDLRKVCQGSPPPLQQRPAQHAWLGDGDRPFLHQPQPQVQAQAQAAWPANTHKPAQRQPQAQISIDDDILGNDILVLDFDNDEPALNTGMTKNSAYGAQHGSVHMGSNGRQYQVGSHVGGDDKSTKTVSRTGGGGGGPGGGALVQTRLPWAPPPAAQAAPTPARPTAKTAKGPAPADATHAPQSGHRSWAAGAKTAGALILPRAGGQMTGRLSGGSDTSGAGQGAKHAVKATEKRDQTAVIAPKKRASAASLGATGNAKKAACLLVPGTHEDLDLPTDNTQAGQTINAATSTGLTKLRTVLSSLTSHHSVLLGVLYACTAGAASQYYSAAQPGPTKDQQAALRKARNASNKRGAGAADGDADAIPWQVRGAGIGLVITPRTHTNNRPHHPTTPTNTQPSPLFYIPLPPRAGETNPNHPPSPNQQKALQLIVDLIWPRNTTTQATMQGRQMGTHQGGVSGGRPMEHGMAGGVAGGARPGVLLSGDSKGLVRELLYARVCVPGPVHQSALEDPTVLGWLDKPDLGHRDENEGGAKGVGPSKKFTYTVQDLCDLHNLADHDNHATSAKEWLPTLSPCERLRAGLLLTSRLNDHLLQRTHNWLSGSCRRLEMQTSLILGCLEARGIGVAREVLDNLGQVVQNQLDQIVRKAHRCAGKEFNLSSPQQLAHILYEHMKLPVQTASGRNAAKTQLPTDEGTLRKLCPHSPLPQIILDYRQIKGQQDKWLNADWLHQAGRDTRSLGHAHTRVHCSWNAVNTATGRISSSNPNMQAVTRYIVQANTGARASGKGSGSAAVGAAPAGAAGAQGLTEGPGAGTGIGTAQQQQQAQQVQQQCINIRAAFIPSEGCVLLSADYSQVELRVLAHLSDDPKLIALLRQPKQDVFTQIATKLRGSGMRRDAPVSSEERETAKRVVYGMIYGMGVHGLTSMDFKQAQRLIDAFHNSFSTVKSWAETMEAQALRDGYVTTMMGRRRPLPKLQSQDAKERAEARRRVVNTIVQGSAADLMKHAMLQWETWAASQQSLAKATDSATHQSPLLVGTVHDELLVECAATQDVVQATARKLVDIMSSAHRLQVPLIVNVSYGPSWGQQEKLDS